MTPQLTIVIVNYNVKHYLDQCLDSVARASRGLSVEVVVVDNHSHDGSVEWLSRRHPDVRFIACRHNLGFAKANNLAIRQTTSPYVLLLNPDTVVAEDTLQRVMTFMDAHPQGGRVWREDAASRRPASTREPSRTALAYGGVLQDDGAHGALSA